VSTEPLPRSEAIMEVLPLCLVDGAVEMVTLGDLAIEVGWHASSHPSEVACDVAREFGLEPVVAHSTSWRHDPGKLIVSYAVVVEPPKELAPMLHSRRVGREELARGSAVRAPKAIGVEQVVEHALRHLAWLQRDDAEIRRALPGGWTEALRAYPPEPFRPFEGEWS
jgi:hypothetical protein